MEVLESLVRRFVVDENGDTKSTERSWRSAHDGERNVK